MGSSKPSAKALYGEVVISGNITVQKLGESNVASTSNAQLAVWLRDSVFSVPVVSKSGSFSFNLKVGEDYTLVCQKTGYTSKNIKFELKEVHPDLLDKTNNDFDLTLNLIESDFLSEEVLIATQNSEIFWDYSYDGLSYSNKELKRKWSIIDSLAKEYKIALNKLPATTLTDQIAALQESIIWPNGTGPSYDLLVFGDYPLFVGLVQEQKSSKKFSNANLIYASQLGSLKAVSLDVLVLNDQSETLDKEFWADFNPNVLIASQTDNVHAMLKFSLDENASSFILNEPAFGGKGFVLAEPEQSEANAEANDSLQKGTLQLPYDPLRDMGLLVALKNPENVLPLKSTESEVSQRSLGSSSFVDQFVSSELTSSVLQGEKVMVGPKSKIEQKSRIEGLGSLATTRSDRSAANREIGYEAKELQRIAAEENDAQTSRKIKGSNDEYLEPSGEADIATETSFLWVLVLGLIAVLMFLIHRKHRGSRKNTQIEREVGISEKKVHLQMTLLEEKSKEMSDSINYAKRIQLAMLPRLDAIQAHFNQSFVLFEPKDVVAGDFFWMEEFNGLIYFAVADCTGHGVPGAMMSVLCHGALDRALKESNNPSPAELLTLTRKYVIAQIATGEGHLMDGMDVALCAYNKITGELQFSGAQNPLWIASERLIEHPKVLVNKLEFGAGYLHEIKGDKQPVGEFFASSSFTNHSIFLAEGDTIYIFSDGFPDQFGGRRGKKLKNSLFKELIGLVQDQDDLGKQKDFLSEYFINWKGDLEQVDDVCVMGIKL